MKKSIKYLFLFLILILVIFFQSLPVMAEDSGDYMDVTWVETQEHSEHMMFMNGIARITLPGPTGDYASFFIDDKGKLLTGTKLPAVTNFNEGIGYVKDNEGNWLPINRKGEILTIVPSSSPTRSNIIDKGVIIQKLKVVDIYGRTIVEGNYDSFKFLDGSNNLYGILPYDDSDIAVVNLKGESIFPYENYESYSPGMKPSLNGLLSVKDNKTGKYAFYNDKGKMIIPFGVEGFPAYSEGRYSVTIDGKAGHIDSEGNIITPLKYDATGSFYNGLAEVWKDGKYAIVNKNGKLITKFIYDVGMGDVSDGMVSVGKEQKDWSYKYGYVSVDGKSSIDCIYDIAGEFSDGHAKVKKDGKWGIIDKTGKTIVPFEYDTLQLFQNNLAVVGKGEKSGVINKSGEIIVPVEYEYVGVGIGNKDIITARKSGNSFDEIYNKKGKLILPARYEYYGSYNPNFTDKDMEKALILKDGNGKFAIFSFDGSQITEFKYDYINSFIHGKATVSIDGKYGMINTDGSEVFPIIYDSCFFEINNSFSNYIRFKKDGKTGLADRTGKILLPCEYDRIDDFIDGIAWVEKDGNFGLIRDIYRFSDMSSWARNEIAQALSLDLVPWESNGYYTNKITRLQFAGIATNLVEKVTGKRITPASIGQFKDTHADAALRAYSAGIISGLGNHYTFAPDVIVTREQAATMLYSAIKYIEKETGKKILSGPKGLDGYSDKNAVSSWAEEAVDSLVASGIMAGTSKTNLSPKKETSIEETVALALRIYNIK